MTSVINNRWRGQEGWHVIVTMYSKRKSQFHLWTSRQQGSVSINIQIFLLSCYIQLVHYCHSSVTLPRLVNGMSHSGNEILLLNSNITSCRRSIPDNCTALLTYCDLIQASHKLPPLTEMEEGASFWLSSSSLSSDIAGIDHFPDLFIIWSPSLSWFS